MRWNLAVQLRVMKGCLISAAVANCLHAVSGSAAVTSLRMEVPVEDGSSLLLRTTAATAATGPDENHHNHNYNHAATTSRMRTTNVTDAFVQLERMRDFRDKVQKERERKNRLQNRRSQHHQYHDDTKLAKQVWDKLPKSPTEGTIERVSMEEWELMDAQQKKRGLGWFGDSGSSGSSAYSSTGLADSGAYYDKWAQAYRMLGGFIDCDHSKSENSHDDNGGGNGNGNGNGNGACSRWMMWAAYVNPNYQGNAYNEYFGDNPTSVLDCHNPDSSWVLLGVYRQEFYQYVEQISKHLWAIDEYEYVVALAGLSYMTKYECFQVGQDSSGNAIYAGVAPQPYGTWQMALYTDGPYCLTPNLDLGMTYDSFGLTTDVSLNGGGGGGSNDKNNNNNDNNNNDDSEVSTWWSDTQEYTLTKLNDVYEEFKYCTSCVDYPTYQDGYFIGDDGTDDDDLINQCWKFYSHSSYTCEADCISKAHAQGSILAIRFGDTVFGKSLSNFYRSQSSSALESKFSRLMANAFVTGAFLLFVATFLAFAVARRSRYRESRSSKSRRLLDGEDAKRSRSVRRSKSGVEGDGLFRSPSSARSKSRSKSKSGKSRSTSRRSRSKSYDAPKEKSSTRNSSSKPKNTESNGDYF